MPRKSTTTSAAWRRWSPERRKRFYETINAKRAARVRRGDESNNSNSRRGMKYAKKDMRIVLARKLRWHIVRHIKTTEDITTLELNALLLINEILKTNDDRE